MGTASDQKTDCPVSLWGKYVYSLTDTSGSSSCNYNSWLDICSATNTLTVNTTLCASTTLYSSEGTLYCMYSLADTSSSSIYVYLYNDDATVDSSTTYRFTCVVMWYSSSLTYMTQHPNECLDSSSQNATLMTTSPGGLYTMYANAPTSSGDNLTLIIAIVVVLLVIIIVAVIVGVCYYKKVYLPKKRDGRSSSKISPDTLPNTAMSGMDDVHPGPPEERRAGSSRGGAGRAGDPRDGSAVTLRPTVSALATYRTPSPYISEGKDVDVDSLLDFDYPTSKQALGDPDGAESGVLLEMEGSIPVYSEAGDTPEPTRMTPMNSGKR
ncbi:hypothetical protein ACOMHN_024240 [Nucella lapillus]